MTSKDFIEAEAGNNGSIILYREGLFWKAYEKSAYAVCTQIKPLKAIKRRLKSLGGGEIVSVGFPCKHEQKYIGSLEHMETMPDRLVLRTLKPIDGQRFEEWETGTFIGAFSWREERCVCAESVTGVIFRMES